VQGIYDDILEVVNDEAKTMREVKEWLDAWTEDRISVIDQQTVNKQTNKRPDSPDRCHHANTQKQTNKHPVQGRAPHAARHGHGPSPPGPL